MPSKKKRNSIKPATILLLIIIVILLAVSVSFYNSNKNLKDTMIEWQNYAHSLEGVAGLEGATKTHIHADFAVYVNSERISFNNSAFDEKDDLVHIHLDNTNGDKIIHVHLTGITFGQWLKSIGGDLNAQCLTLPNQESFCNNENSMVMFFVNGKRNEKYGDYKIQDLDKILVSYGNKDNVTELLKEISSVTDYAKVYSNEQGE